MLLGPTRLHLPLHLIVLCTLLSAAPGARAEPLSRAEPNAATASSGEAQSSTSPAPVSTLGGDLARTRFLIGLERHVVFQVFALTDPNRVIVDLPEITLQLPKDTGGEAVGLVKSFRAGNSAPGKSRVVIDVTQPVVVAGARIEQTPDGKGQRLALEIVPAGAGAAKAEKKPFKTAPFSLGAVGLQPPLPLPAERPDVRAARAFKPVIVIDPGHGGYDSGATKNGTVEKDVVLAFSKILKQKIEAAGRYKVQLTRDSDVFVELGQRVAFAERHNANLFIAVHADYADSNAQARGATIYSLRESVAGALKRSAKDDAADNVLSKQEMETVKQASVEGDLSAVKTILADLAGRELELTKERTNVFSRAVVDLMSASTHMRNDPDQQAAFRVLKTAQFPSVLIELAYVTNKEDAELLKSDAWRDKVSDSIMTAVDNYFSHQIARLPM